MQLEGDLGSHGRLFELLCTISALGKTGILTVQSEHDMLAVTFLEGRIVAADAMNETMEEGLGQVLESQGLVSPAQFSELAAQQQASGDRIADLLMKNGLIGREQLLGAIRLQTYRLLLQLLTWREGEYNLFLGDEISYEDGIEPISVEELLVRSVSDLGVEGPIRGPVPEPESSFEPMASEKTLKVLGRDGEEAGTDPGTVWLTPNEERLLSLLDGPKSVAELMQASGLDQYRTRFSVNRLREAGLVKPARAPLPEIVVPPSGLTPPSSLLRSDIEDRVLDEKGTGSTSPGLVLDSSLAGDVDAPSEEPVKATAKKPAARASAAQEEALGPVVWVWLARTMAFGLLILLVALLPVRSSRNGLFFPFPWQQSQRTEFESGQRTVIYNKIDGASRTYYLLFGRFPEDLEILADLELLSRADQYDPRGNWLSYSATDVRYTVQPLKDGVTVPGLETTGDVAGDFILNPQFVEVTRERSRRPLYLLD